MSARRRIFRALLVALVALVVVRCRVAGAEPLRILVAIGHRAGLPGEVPLKHAVRDATRVRDVFVQFGGVRTDDAAVLAEPTAAGLMAALDRAARLARSRRPEDVTVLFYFSGHGDRENIHLGAEAVPLRLIDAKLGAIPAALRIVVTDACRTADVRVKGVTGEEAFAITVTPSESAVGVVKIHASADGEVAQESDELGGAVFTHYLITGLNGAADVDGDGRVTLAEVYAFAYHHTLYRSTRSSGASQRPSVVFDLKEAAPLVLTQPTNASRIGIPRSSDVRYLVFATGSQTVLAELYGSSDRVVSVAVPPGKYVVHRRSGSRSGAAHVALGPRESREMTPSDFQSVPEETLARKGGQVLLRHHELGVAYGASIARLVTLGHELGGHYAYELDAGWALSFAGRVGAGSRASTDQEASVRWLRGEAHFERRARLGALGLRAGVGPAIEGVVQTLRRNDADRLARAGYAYERESSALLIGAVASVGGRVYPTDAVYVALDGTFQILGGALEGTSAVFLGVGAGASVGIAF